MDILGEHFNQLNRRHFLSRLSLGVGSLALGNLLGCDSKSGLGGNAQPEAGILDNFHIAPKAKRVIYLFQSGGPSQMDLFDYKPMLRKMHGEELPASVRGEQRLTGMTANQSSFPLAAPMFDFSQYGQSGAWVSNLMPYTAEIADELCYIKTMHTEAINHDPAITFFQTGSQQPGRPSIGSWLSYGLGSDNQNLPTFIVLLSRGAQRPQPIYSRLWGNGFLASLHQGVQFRAGSDPVLYLNNPEGMDAKTRRDVLDHLNELNTKRLQDFGDPEIESRIAQYEMAYRMQTSVPDALDLSDEPDSTFEMYGEEARKPGTYAANCLLARRLAERDVKFVQLYHLGWDQHTDLPREITSQARDTDRASAALVKDLKQRGLLDDTLVVWGGEFGRTNYSQGQLTANNYGRDHHPRCFTVWMAGGGTKPGITYGETDEFSYNIVKDPVHVHDFQATLLHLLGVDHERLTFKHQGRRYRLTDVHGHIVKGVLA
ncbi:DUF1501 domain-containing protein [Tunicatimonas pelagia]|uniref:DUF1501 domain-containing protein n=1 Tax=Tunicatimonas pelagia TaxID=931531 RepID=UPI00266621F2|nr:DUF1501 domain-containing protein [Tunicatimonas pelagia]WKN45612.1 DUF1501 domain-containing protein [Tunicatimonas pelagia]